MKHAAACLAAFAVSLAASAALASPEYPGRIQQDLQLSYTPDCTLCHVGTPGFGTATTPFADSMQTIGGLVASDVGSLDKALTTLSNDMTDSDHDGTPDIQELEDHSDPNTSGESEAFGCAPARIAGDPSNAGAGFAAAAVAAALVARRRRRA